MNWLDPIGAGLSLLCTYYFTKAQRFAWLIALSAISTNGVLYWQKGIYGKVFLDGIYFISMIYGWLQWSDKPKQQACRRISSVDYKQALLLSVFALLGIYGLAYGLKTGMGSEIPYWDATITVLSLLAQYLLCIKVIECWILWFIVDALVGILQFHKAIPFHAVVNLMYLGMAVLGYRRWYQMRGAES